MVGAILSSWTLLHSNLAAFLDRPLVSSLGPLDDNQGAFDNDGISSLCALGAPLWFESHLHFAMADSKADNWEWNASGQCGSVAGCGCCVCCPAVKANGVNQRRELLSFVACGGCLQLGESQRRELLSFVSGGGCSHHESRWRELLSSLKGMRCCSSHVQLSRCFSC